MKMTQREKHCRGRGIGRMTKKGMIWAVEGGGAGLLGATCYIFPYGDANLVGKND